MNDSLQIHYFHGFRSSSDSNTLKTISATLRDDTVRCDTIDYEDNLEAQWQLLAQAVAGCDLLIGSSHGGFVADFFSRRRKIPAILINPSVRPSVNLAKYGVPDSLLRQYRQLEDQRDGYVYHQLPRIVILGNRDETLDSSIAEAFYHDTLIWRVDAPHRLPDHLTAELVTRAIKTMAACPFSW